jgi:archaetidylinositol phosphate synthase
VGKEIKMDMYLLKFPYRRILQPLAGKLGWLHPDIVSYFAVVVTAATAWCFYDSANHPVLLIIAILLILLRMTLNTLDGVMAIRRGNLSLKGEIVNALPDRYSDILMVAGIALSPLCRNWLGIVALSTMFLVSYSGMLGKALTVSWQHHGPMGKVERMVLVMVFALVQFVVLPEKQTVQWFGIQATPVEWSMGIMTVLGQYTILRRLKGQFREIKYKEAVEKLDSRRNQSRAIVIYDSATNNTRIVAEKIAEGLGCFVKSISDIEGIDNYELIVIGTPNIRRKPTQALQKYQSTNRSQSAKLATFVTFGLPVWGQITSGTCMNSMAIAWDKKPVGRFSCPGYHQKFKTYKRRPNDKDLVGAYLFGVKLSKKLK